MPIRTLGAGLHLKTSSTTNNMAQYIIIALIWWLGHKWTETRYFLDNVVQSCFQVDEAARKRKSMYKEDCKSIYACGKFFNEICYAQ